jgi:hypothetical protein
VHLLQQRAAHAEGDVVGRPAVLGQGRQDAARLVVIDGVALDDAHLRRQRQARRMSYESLTTETGPPGNSRNMWRKASSSCAAPQAVCVECSAAGIEKPAMSAP